MSSVSVVLLLGLLLSAAGAQAARSDGPKPPGAPQASVGSGFTYQGQLKQNGSPVNATCAFQFSLWDAASNGTQLGNTQAANAVSVSNGVFTVVLNSGNEFSTSEVPFAGEERYLQAAVRCPAGSGAYTTLSRQAITPAPYALSLQPGAVISDSNSLVRLGGPYVDGLRSNGVSVGVMGYVGEIPLSLSDTTGVYGSSTLNNGKGIEGWSYSATGYGGFFVNTTEPPLAGAAIYAGGDVKQSQNGTGLVKAAAYANCSTSGSQLIYGFNNVNTTLPTISNGTLPGFCKIDFGFNVEARFIQVTAYGNQAGGARGATVDFVNGSQVQFIRYVPNTGLGENGTIYVIVY